MSPVASFSYALSSSVCSVQPKTETKKGYTELLDFSFYDKPIGLCFLDTKVSENRRNRTEVSVKTDCPVLCPWHAFTHQDGAELAQNTASRVRPKRIEDVAEPTVCAPSCSRPNNAPVPITLGSLTPALLLSTLGPTCPFVPS